MAYLKSMLTFAAFLISVQAAPQALNLGDITRTVEAPCNQTLETDLLLDEFPHPLPEGSFKYKVKYSVPPITLQFFHYEGIFSERNEAQVEAVIQQARIQAMQPGRCDRFMRTERISWASGDVDMSLVPRKRQQSETGVPRWVGLTWGIWENTLVGINRFRLAFPGRDFVFKVFVEQGGFPGFECGTGQMLDDREARAIIDDLAEGVRTTF